MENEKKVEETSAEQAGSFQELADSAKKVSWADHLRNARKLLSGFMGGENRKKSEFYRLSERMNLRGKTKKGTDSLKDIYDSWDECGVEIPTELGEMVEKYVASPDFCFGVHHSYAINGANYEQDGVLNSILKTGLLNWGGCI